MSVIVPTLTEAVGRKGTQRYDERDGRDKRDQTNAEETRAQRGELPVKGRISVACERPAGNSSAKYWIIEGSIIKAPVMLNKRPRSPLPVT